MERFLRPTLFKKDYGEDIKTLYFVFTLLISKYKLTVLQLWLFNIHGFYAAFRKLASYAFPHVTTNSNITLKKDRKLNFYLYFLLINYYLFGCAGSSLPRMGFLFIPVCGLLAVLASLVVEHRLGSWGVRDLERVGSVVVAQGLNCSSARGIFQDQGQTYVPCTARQNFNHWTTREVPNVSFKSNIIFHSVETLIYFQHTFINHLC